MTFRSDCRAGIETNVPIEASQYIPYPIEEIYLDFEMRDPVARER